VHVDDRAVPRVLDREPAVVVVDDVRAEQLLAARDEGLGPARRW